MEKQQIVFSPRFLQQTNCDSCAVPDIFFQGWRGGWRWGINVFGGGGGGRGSETYFR